MSFSERELETDAMDKCSRSLERLSNRSKLRVIRYLVDTFDLIPQTPPADGGGVTQNINFQQNNLVLPSPNEVPNQLPTGNATVILPAEAIVKEYTKSETDVLILLAYHFLRRGNKTFTRTDLREEYRANNLQNDSRKSNFTRNFDAMIKRSWIKALNNDDFAITDAGTKGAEEIMSGKAVAEEIKASRKRGNKKTAAKNDIVEATEVESEPIADGQA